MQKINFVNNQAPYINAENLNAMQSNIENEFTDIKQWTPTMENANVTYTNQTGYYLKLGRLVFIWFRLQGKINSVTSPGYAFINGLPFSNSFTTSGSVYEHLNITDDNTRNVLLKVVGNQLGIQSDGQYAGTSIENWYASNNTFYLAGSAVYYTDN